jgi:hypothetical protein
MRTFLLFFFIAAMAAAQIVAPFISVGAKVGVPVTQAISDYYGTLDTGRWTVGPTIEFRLPFGFSIEADALYRGYREQFSFASGEFIPAGASTIPAIYVSSQSSSKIWDFPLLLKYRIGEHRFQPFEVAGYTFSHSTTNVTTFQSCVSSAAVCQAATPAPFEGTTHYSFTGGPGGPTVGLGVEHKYGRMKFAPEVRYTHLSNPTANVLTVMVGVTF